MAWSDRPAVKRRIVEVLTEAIDVRCSYDLHGAIGAPEAVWLGDVTGDVAAVDFGHQRQGMDDTWTLNLAVAVSGKATVADADERCQEILSDVCAALFTAPRLGDDMTLTTAIYPGRLDGPNGFRVSPHDPASSVAELTLSIRCAMRGTP